MWHEAARGTVRATSTENTNVGRRELKIRKGGVNYVTDGTALDGQAEKSTWVGGKYGRNINADQNYLHVLQNLSVMKCDTSVRKLWLFQKLIIYKLNL